MALETDVVIYPTRHPIGEFANLPQFRTLLCKLCEAHMERFFMRVGLQGEERSFEKGTAECGLIEAKDKGGRGLNARVVTD